MSEQQTPIYGSHVELDGKMVPFAGFMMPVQYPMGIRAEHQHVRNQVGIFDVSHMGEFRVRGPKALETLQWLTTNDVSKLTAGKAHYSLLPNSAGGIVDDLIVYCIEPGEDYLLCVNAANIAKDFQFITENNRGADLDDQSSQWGLIAVQGPQALSTLKNMSGLDLANQAPFTFVHWTYQGKTALFRGPATPVRRGLKFSCPFHKPSSSGRSCWPKVSRCNPLA